MKRQERRFPCVVWKVFATPWTAACQASLSISNSQSLLKLMSIKSVMSSNHLILCHPLLLPPLIFPIIRVSPHFTGGLTPFGPQSGLQEVPVTTRKESGVLCFPSTRGLTPWVTRVLGTEAVLWDESWVLGTLLPCFSCPNPIPGPPRGSQVRACCCSERVRWLHRK